MTAPSGASTRPPSPASLEKRALRAERQAAFATKAGWLDVAAIYRATAQALRALVGPDRRTP